MHAKPAGIVLEQVDVSDDHEQRGTLFSGREPSLEFHTMHIPSVSPGYFEYQLQTGVVLAFDTAGQLAWSSAVNAPIAAVWELKNGQLHEKSLFETNTINRSGSGVHAHSSDVHFVTLHRGGRAFHATTSLPASSFHWRIQRYALRDRFSSRAETTDLRRKKEHQ